MISFPRVNSRKSSGACPLVPAVPVAFATYRADVDGRPVPLKGPRRCRIFAADRPPSGGTLVGISLRVFLPIAAPFTAKRATGKCLKIRVQSKILKSDTIVRSGVQGLSPHAHRQTSIHAACSDRSSASPVVITGSCQSPGGAIFSAASIGPQAPGSYSNTGAFDLSTGSTIRQASST